MKLNQRIGEYFIVLYFIHWSPFNFEFKPVYNFAVLCIGHMEILFCSFMKIL